MKICVYAICKNESKHIKRWYESMKEADEIYVLDTDSTDNSVELLKKFGVIVKEKQYKNFAFDEARNDALKMVKSDADIVVSTDLDEVFNKGWRSTLESIWTDNTDRVKYNLNYTFDSKGNSLMSYYISKIHTRNNYKWVNKVHEVLEFTLDRKENILTTDKIEINHYKDISKDRSYYLKLLEEDVKLDQSNPRNIHYLGREYMYNKEYNKAIDMLIKHVYMPSSTWKEEKCSSMRFISICYKYLNRLDESEMWLKKSIKLLPGNKENYCLLGFYYYEIKDYKKSIKYLLKADSIKEKTNNYINEEYAWNERVYDILSLCYFYIGDIKNSLKYVKLAVDINPNDERLKNNLEIILNVNKN